MPTTTRTASVASCDGMHFANFVLKRWLHSIGPARRAEVLRKLRIGLQSLKLSRRQVHCGLVQLLASRTCVILVREPFHKRHGSKIRREEIEEIFYSGGSFVDKRSQEKYEDVPKLETPKFIGERITHDQRIDGINVYEVLSPNSSQGYISCKSEKSLAIMHPFEEALMEFEQDIPTKMNRKLCSKRRRSTTVSLDIKKTCKYENPMTHIENKSSISEETVPNEALAKVEISTTQTTHEVKKGHLQLNLNSCYRNKSSNCVESETYRKVDSTKSDVDKESCTVNIDVTSTANRNKYSKCERNESVLAGTEATASTMSVRERRKRRSDDQNRKRIFNKLRSCFGDCVSLSEDEQERDILRTTYKKRRKSISINSCDSDVSVTTENRIVVDVDVFKGIQIAIPESTVNDTSSETEIDLIDNEPKKVIRKKSTDIRAHSTSPTIDNAYAIYDESKGVTSSRETVIEVHSSMAETFDEDIFDRTVVHSDTCNKSNEVVKDNNNDIQNSAQKAQKTIGLIDKVVNLSDFSKPPQVTERLVINVPISEPQAEENVNCITLGLDMPDIPTSEDELVINEDVSDGQEDTTDKKRKENTTDLDEYIQVDTIKTCEVPAPRDLKIKEDLVENVLHETVDENLNSINMPKVIAKLIVDDEDFNSTNVPEIQNSEEVLLNSTGGHDVDASFVPSPEIDVTTVDNVEYKSNDEPAVQETTDLNNTSVEKPSQLNEVPQFKIRILSSAELGSRWCPTPVNPVTTVVQFSSANTMASQDPPIYSTSLGTSATQTVPATSMITVPVSTPTVETTFSNNGLCNKDIAKSSKSVHTAVLKIYNLIEKIRTRSTAESNYDKCLCTEFQKLGKILKVHNYVAITKGVVHLLNTKMLLSPPLSFIELLTYSPLIYKLCISNSPKFGIDDRPTDQTTSLQDVHYNQQIENMCAITSAESFLHYLWSKHEKYIKHTGYSKRPRKNLQENANLQTQNNSQNNTLMNPAVINSQIPPYASVARTQTSIQEQNSLNSHVAQSLTVGQQLSNPSMSIHEHATAVLPSHVRFSDKNVPQTVTQSIPQINLEDVPQTTLQNVPQTTLQNVPQNTFHNVPQTTFQSILQSTLKNVPQTTLKNVPQTTFHNVPQITLQNVPQTTFQNVPQNTFQNVPQTTFQSILQSTLQSTLKNVPQTTLKNVPQTTLKNVPQTTFQNVPRTTFHSVPQTTLQNVPQNTMQNVPQTTFQSILQSTLQNVPLPILQTVPQTTIQNVLQIVLQNVPLTTLQNVPQTTLQDVLHTALQNIPLATLQNAPQTTLQNVLQTAIQNIPQTTFQNVPQTTIHQNVPRSMARNVPQGTFQNVPQNAPQRNLLHNGGRILRNPVPQNVQPAHINLQNVRESTVNQLHQYVHRYKLPPAYNMTQGAQLQNSPQNTQIYIPRCVRDPNTGNASQRAPINMSQTEQIRANAVAPRVPQNCTKKKYIPVQHPQNIHQPRMPNPTAPARRTQNPQISLESMTNMFHVLEYLSNSQKLMLMNQIDYYFKCTTWLQQNFIPELWHRIHAQRNLLLQFQTLLKHLVAKESAETPLSNRCQENESNVLTNIFIEVPKMVKIIVRENEGMQCQIEVPQANQEANNNHQNLDSTVTQSQLKRQNEATDTSQNKNVPNETVVQTSKISDQNVLEKSIPSESNIQDPTLSSNLHEIDGAEKESTNFKNTEEQDLQRSSKNNLQQSSPHLVTVEICPHNDQVIVIDTNNIDINKSATKKGKKIENKNVQDVNTLESSNKRLQKDEETNSTDVQVANMLKSLNKRLRKDEEINGTNVQVASMLKSPKKRLQEDEEINSTDVQVASMLESPNKRLQKHEDTKNEDVKVVNLLDSPNELQSPKKRLQEDEEINSTDVQVARMLKSPNKRLQEDEEINSTDVQVASMLESPNKRLQEDDKINSTDVQVASMLESPNKRLQKHDEIINEDIEVVNLLESPNEKLRKEEEINGTNVQVASMLEFPNKRLQKHEEIKNEDVEVINLLESPNEELRMNEEDKNEDVEVINMLESPNVKLRMDEEIENEDVEAANMLESPNKSLKKEDEEIGNVASTSESANDFFYEVVHLKECSSDFEYINTIVLDDDLSSKENSECKIMNVRSISQEIFNVDEDNTPCLRCGKLSTVVCGNCLIAKYCSKKCSTRHWRHHFKDCNSVMNYSY